MMNIICIGDSITDGYAALMDQWPTILQFELEKWRPGKYKVLNMGKSGDTTADGMVRYQQNVVDKNPDLLIIEYGLNDCVVRKWAKYPRVGLEEFKKNLRNFYYGAKKNKAKTVFISNHPIVFDPKNGKERNNSLKKLAKQVKPYNKAIFDLGKELKSPVIDMPREIKKRQINTAVMVTDGAHLSTEGCLIYGQIVFEFLKPILK